MANNQAARHIYCQNYGVLLEFEEEFQGGIILACGQTFSYVLTVRERSVIRDNNSDLHIIFGNGTEKVFLAQTFELHSSSYLSIISLHDQFESSLLPVKFHVEEVIENAVVHTLTFAPKVSYIYQGRNQVTAATSYFLGGNAGFAGARYRGLDVFFHNCSAGYDVTEGSTVFNGNCECVGMNMRFFPGSTMALRLSSIKEEIALIFPDTKNMNFEQIRDYLEAII